MAKLNQLIAVANGKKSQAVSAVTAVYHRLQKPELLSGLARTYRAKDEDGERLPDERKGVQFSAGQAIREVRDTLEALFNAVGAMDATNCLAKADVKVDGVVVLPSVPVTHLLFIEKQLVDLHAFVDKLPTLDPAEDWHFDAASDTWKGASHETRSTKKVMRNHVMADATDKHPAQVQVYTEDVTAGYWDTVKFSGAIQAKDKNGMLARVRKLQEAVKFAREEANGCEVVDFKSGAAVLGFVFGDK